MTDRNGRRLWIGVAAAAMWLGLCLAMPNASQAGHLGPYTADANTLHLYHFDETGVPIVDQGVGTPRDLDTAQGTFGVPSVAGYGSAFDVVSGNAPIPFAVNDIPADQDGIASNNGHAAHSFRTAQAEFEGPDGAFTYELLINISQIADTGNILSRDSYPTRGPVIAIFNNKLRFFSGTIPIPEAQIPTVGDHAFVPNQWYHVAVTYNGQDGVPDSLKFYWTSMGFEAEAANEIGSFSSVDAPNSNNTFFVGGAAASSYRFETQGQVDEVRISDVARGPDEFLFAPTTTYSCVGFESPMDDPPVKVRRKRALPLKARLFDSEGGLATDADINDAPVLQVLYSPEASAEPIDVTNDAIAVGLGTEGNQFEYTVEDKWQYNLKTSNYSAPGTYTISIVPGDHYVIEPGCETSFVID